MTGDALGRAAEGPDGADVDAQLAAAGAAKAEGNKALKSADLPLALEHYQEAVRLCDKAIDAAPQPRLLRNNDFVRYGSGAFAMIETAFPQFEDYVIMDLASRNIVKHKVGRHDFDMVSKRFLRKELHAVPQEMFDMRLGCLQNIALASLKLARGSRRTSDYQEAVARADDALAMDAKSAKALMRKGQALVEMRDWGQAAKVLVAASHETKGKDPEVQRLLEEVVIAKGKGRGKGKARMERGFENPCKVCGDPKCVDIDCKGRRPPPVPEVCEECCSDGSELCEEDEEVFRKMAAAEFEAQADGKDSSDEEPASGSGDNADIPTAGGTEGAGDGSAAAAPREPLASSSPPPPMAAPATTSAAKGGPPAAKPRAALSARRISLGISGALGALCLVAAVLLNSRSPSEPAVQEL